MPSFKSLSVRSRERTESLTRRAVDRTPFKDVVDVALLLILETKQLSDLEND